MTSAPAFSGYRAASRFEYPSRALTIASVLALPVAFVAVGLLVTAATGSGELTFTVTPDTFVQFVLALLLVVPVTIVGHELVHGLVANLLGYRVVYGTTRIGPFLPAAYAAALDQRITRRDMALTAASPLVVVTVVGTLLAAVVPPWLVAVVALGMLVNAVGAVGDVYLLYRIARLPPGVVFYDVSIEDMFVYEPATA